LDSEPTKVTAWVSGDTKYRLYINGKMAGRGPSEIGGIGETKKHQTGGITTIMILHRFLRKV